MESSENEAKPPPGFERVTSDNHKVVISPFIFEMCTWIVGLWVYSVVGTF